MLLQPANFDYVDLNWKSLKTSLPVIKDTDPKELGYGDRYFQIECYKRFENKKNTIFIAPTGSGKSLVQIFNAGREIIKTNYKQKQVFIVPQLNIGNGFSEYRHKKLKINNEIYGWEITTNCCFDNEDSVNKIKKFLLEDCICNSYRADKVLGGCTSVVSYSALLSAFNKMTPEEKLLSIQNASFRPDEVHHISGVEEGGVASNRLGEFCKYVLDNNGSLHLTTATFFRGDQGVILGTHYLEDFEIYRVPFLDHWKTLGLKELHQNYVCYKDSKDLMEQILESIKLEKDQPPMIIVPSDGMKFFKKTNKSEWVQKLVIELENIFGKNKVLDLVSFERQKNDKIRLISENQDFSAIVTCMIGREGTDWPACSRVYNTVLDANALQPVQKLGRALRQYDGKIDVKMINYIEYFDNWNEDSDIVRSKLSDRFNAVVAASMLDDMMYPILMPTIPTPGNEENDEIVESKNVSLEDVYGSVRNELIEDLMKRILSVPSSEKNDSTIDEIVNEIIEEYKEDMLEDVDFDILKTRLRKEIIRRMNPDNPKLKINGMIIDFIRENGWDKVVKENISDKSPFLGAAKTKDLEELQKYLNRTDWMEKIEEVKKIGINNIKSGHKLYHFLLKQRKDYVLAKNLEN